MFGRVDCMRKVGAYISKAHILDQLRVDIRLCEEGLDGLIDDKI